MKKTKNTCWMVVFPSTIGWFAVLGEKYRVKALTFGHGTSEAAKKRLFQTLDASQRDCIVSLGTEFQTIPSKMRLVKRLQDYAKGAGRDDFCDIHIDLGHISDFKRRVLELCRQIPLGNTFSYGQLAAMAGSPGAAQAVGNCMASNNIPIIIPCHRVVSAKGCVGSYSAPGGVHMKKRLLTLEKGLKKGSLP
jgi:O-6-methylguanine DNA methyltransferase